MLSFVKREKLERKIKITTGVWVTFYLKKMRDNREPSPDKLI